MRRITGDAIVQLNTHQTGRTGSRFICTSVPVFFTPTMSICRAIESRELYKYNYTEEQTSFRYDELNTGTVREQEK
jgi:hypothetical protein